MKKYYYMLVTPKNNPLLINEQLPIFWSKEVAKKVGLVYGSKVIKVSILQIDTKKKGSRVRATKF